jgi:peptidyl-prolyl cis-trans isomerase SurA
MSHHAEVDSLIVSDDEVDKAIEQRIDFFVNQIGSVQKLEAYFGKTISELREEFQTLFREQILGQRMESKVTSEVKATPKDVLQFYNRIPEDSLPIFPEEIYLSQLVVFPKVDAKERERITNKLNGFKQRIQDGEDFAFLASLYSDDPGSAKQGGDLGFVKKGKLVPKFESVAFRLQEDELSEVVETKFGFHLIQMVKRRGEQFKIRHILIKPKISVQAINDAKSKLDSLVNLMDSDTLSFEQLAVKYSEDESKNNGGVIVNPQTGSSSFVLNELDASVSSTIDGLSQNEMSKPTVFETYDGRKACRIIHVDRIIEEHKANLKEDYDRIQSVALQELKAVALQNWKREKIKETYIDIKDDFGCVWSDNWKKK